MQEGNILSVRKDDVCFIQLTGKVTYTASARFDHLINEVTTDKGISDIVLDVNQATYIDSTNLGLMAKVARFMLGTFHRKPVILCDNHDINVILASMGFDTVFEIISKSISERLDFETAPHIEQNHKERIHMILGAHRVLMEMNNRNRETFKPVVEAFEKELK